MALLQQIEPQSCGCDAQVRKKNLIGIDEALARITRETSKISGTERLQLAKSQGRILEHSVRSLGLTPPFDNAAMDGYAIRSKDLKGAGPWSLKLQDRIPAGKLPTSHLMPGSAAQIFTGAPIPPGADAVVMQEDIERDGSEITFDRPVASGSNVRLAGEDMKRGQTIVRSGRQLTARDVAACAAAGHEKLTVCRKIRVALVVTGDEIHANGHERGPAGIWDINTPMLSAELTRPDVDLFSVHYSADTRDGLRKQLNALSQEADLVITTGGISVGEEDHVKPALQDLGGALIFSGVAMKPGKPVSFGRLNKAFWLGLPGNPLSSYVAWVIFGKSVCKVLAGASQTLVRQRHVVLAQELRHKPGRCELRPARLVGTDCRGYDVVDFPDATHSGRVAQLPQMDGLLIVPSDVEKWPKGALAEFQPF